METIYNYITGQKNKYERPIQLDEGWSWGMKAHLRRSYLYKNSQFEEENDNRELRPNRNIVLGILNVQYRTEGFDVKDIELYVNNEDEYYKSFLADKFHSKWSLDNSIDTFIDELVESYCDYGGALVRKTEDSRPEVVDLRTIAFCNQRDLLGSPFGVNHSFSPTQLRKMKKWGKPDHGATMDIETLIRLVQRQGDEEIKIIEVHGELPTEYLSGVEVMDESKKDEAQIQVVAFYQDEKGNEQGVTLFKSREPQLPFKLLKRDDIKGRALGRGGVEELFDSQEWTNWNEVKITEMLEAASKIIPITDDATLAAKHPSGMKNMDNLEFLQVGEGKTVGAFDNTPRNITVFNNALDRWQQQAQIVGSASEPLLNQRVSAGTPFKLFEAQTAQGIGIHEYRQGKIAVFVDEIYRDWILPHIQKEIVKGDSFLVELSANEMLELSEKVTQHAVNRALINKVLEGSVVFNEDKQALREQAKGEFLNSGNKKFVEILKGEMGDVSLSIRTNIAGKQKNLQMLTDKVVNVIRQYLATPQIRQDPEMTKLMNTVLESSGLSPIMFSLDPQQAQGQLPQANQTVQIEPTNQEPLLAQA